MKEMSTCEGSWSTIGTRSLLRVVTQVRWTWPRTRPLPCSRGHFYIMHWPTKVWCRVQWSRKLGTTSGLKSCYVEHNSFTNLHHFTFSINYSFIFYCHTEQNFLTNLHHCTFSINYSFISFCHVEQNVSTNWSL